MIKIFSVITAICLIGSIMGIILFANPVDGQIIPSAGGFGGLILGGLFGGIIAMFSPFILIFVIIFLPFLLPFVIILIILIIVFAPPGGLFGGGTVGFIIDVMILLGLGALLVITSPFMFLIGLIALITVPFWGVPLVLFLLSFSVIGFIVLTFSLIIVTPILLIGAFILQMFFGVPAFSILFSLFQMIGDLVLIPLSLIKPITSGFLGFIQSIGKIGKTEVTGVI